MPRKKNPRGPSAGVLAAISARLSEACHEVTICQWLEDLTPRFLHHPRNLVTVVTVGKDNGFRAHVVATSRHEMAPTVRGRDVQLAWRRLPHHIPWARNWVRWADTCGAEPGRWNRR